VGGEAERERRRRRRRRRRQNLFLHIELNQASKSLPFELSSLGDSLLTLHALSDTPDYAEHLRPALDLLAAWITEALAAWSQATGTRQFAETLFLGEPLALMHRLLTAEETPATKAVLGLHA
jgi:hypothetical protein